MRNTKRKPGIRAITLLLAVVTLLSVLTACGKQEASEPESQPGAVSADADVSSAAAAGQKDWSKEKKITIDIMTFDTGEADPNSETDRIKQYIEDKFNCKFRVSTVTYGTQYVEKLNVVIAGGDYPDLYKVMWADFIKNSYEDGILSNIDELVADGNLTNLKAYLDEARQYQNLTAFDGEYYAIPMKIGVYQHGLWYRKDWLDKLGLSVPTTMDEFYEVAKALKEADLDGMGAYGFSCDSNWWLNHFHCMYTGSWDYRLMDDGTIQHYRALDGMKDSYAFWAKMYREGILDQSIYTGTNSMELFVTGKTGMMMNNCYASQIQYVLDQIQINYPEAEVGIMQLPAGELGSHQITGTPYLDYTAISSTAEDPERIAAILDYILSPEGQNLLRNGIEGIHYTTNADGTITKNVEECKKEKFGAGEYGPHWIMGLVYSDPYYISDDFEYLDFFNENKKRLEDALNTDYFITMFAPLDGYSSDVTDKYLAKFNELYNQFDQKFIMGELEVNDENWQLWKDTIESEAHYSELVEDWTNAYREYEAAQSD